jgi:hypothetical protein
MVEISKKFTTEACPLFALLEPMKPRIRLRRLHDSRRSEIKKFQKTVGFLEMRSIMSGTLNGLGTFFYNFLDDLKRGKVKRLYWYPQKGIPPQARG